MCCGAQMVLVVTMRTKCRSGSLQIWRIYRDRVTWIHTARKHPQLHYTVRSPFYQKEINIKKIQNPLSLVSWMHSIFKQRHIWAHMDPDLSPALNLDTLASLHPIQLSSAFLFWHTLLHQEHPSHGKKASSSITWAQSLSYPHRVCVGFLPHPPTHARVYSRFTSTSCPAG